MPVNATTLITYKNTITRVLPQLQEDFWARIGAVEGIGTVEVEELDWISKYSPIQVEYNVDPFGAQTLLRLENPHYFLASLVAKIASSVDMFRLRNPGFNVEVGAIDGGRFLIVTVSPDSVRPNHIVIRFGVRVRLVPIERPVVVEEVTFPTSTIPEPPARSVAAAPIDFNHLTTEQLLDMARWQGRRTNHSSYTTEGRVIGVSEKAVHVESEEGWSRWIPKSQIWRMRQEANGQVEVEFSRWIYNKMQEEERGPSPQVEEVRRQVDRSMDMPLSAEPRHRLTREEVAEAVANLQRNPSPEPLPPLPPTPKKSHAAAPTDPPTVISDVIRRIDL